MLISEHVCTSINEQIGNEFGAMMQYLAIAAHFDRETLPMLAGHFYKQAEEEKEHAYKFIKFLLDAGGRVGIPTIPAPQAAFQFAEDAVKLSLEREKEVTRQINNLVGMAKAESDYTTDTFLQWFVNEQLEEVSSMQDLLSIVQRAGEGNLLRVEEYLAREGGKGGTFFGNGAKD
jgi:ferritin